MTICVADGGGVPLALARLDDAFPASAELAMAKARTAALFRKPSADLEAAANGARPALLSVGEAMLGGGEPIFVDGYCARARAGSRSAGSRSAGSRSVRKNAAPSSRSAQVGAVGVSGVLPGEDAEVARAGVDAVQAL